MTEHTRDIQHFVDEQHGRFMKVKTVEKNLAGQDWKAKANKYNGTRNDIAGDWSETAERQSRTAGDIAELVFDRFIRQALPEADIVTHCDETGENSPVDFTVNGRTIDVKARDLSRNPPKCDLLVVAERAERKADTVDWYVNIVVGRDRDRCMLLGCAPTVQVLDSKILNLAGTPDRVVNERDLQTIDTLLNKIAR